MKTRLILFFSLFALTSFQAQSQTTLTKFVVDSAQTIVCDTSYYINIFPQSINSNSNAYANMVFDGTNYMNTTLNASVDWGDNNVTTHTGTAVGTGMAISWSNSWHNNGTLVHGYAQGGTYVVTITLTEPISGSTISNTFTVIIGQCSSSLYTTTVLDCDGDSLYEATLQQVPITISNALNTYTSTSNNNWAYFSNVFPGKYAVSVDTNWLKAHAYQIFEVRPDSVYFDATNGGTSVTIILTCDSSLFDDQCLSGTVFCDADNDGILDSMETVIPNAPITLVLPGLNTTTIVDSSDANGNYNFSYNGPPNYGVGQLELDYQWMLANGYYPSPNTSILDSISDIDCTDSTIINIPIICDTNALSVHCVEGYLFCDKDKDGVLDSTETVLSNVKLNLSGLTNITVTTDSTGYFSFSGWQLSGGSVIISIDSAWLATNGYSANQMTFITNLNCTTQNIVYIGLDCVNSKNCADLWTTVTSWSGYYQNKINSIKLSWGNHGQIAPGNYTMTLDYPTGVTPITSSINNPNYTISGNTITWSINSTSTWFSKKDVIYFSTPSGIPDSTFHIFSSTISSANDICDTSNNYGTLGMYVGVSYDPNDKSVNKPLYVNPDKQDIYTYVVRFQNTGTAPAQDVFVLDTLSNHLDWSTLEVLETTHRMQLVDNGSGVIKFDFPQIWLPDSTNNEPESHGHIVYRIKEKASVGLGDVIENTAYIYFDQNAPVITNTTRNINLVYGLSIGNEKNIGFMIYPNPANNELNLVSETLIQSVQITDLSGKLILNQLVNSNQIQLDVSMLSKGLYSVQITTNENIVNKIIVKN